jgi:hypothetical protein
MASKGEQSRGALLRALSLALIMAAVVVSGCGDDESSGSEGSLPTSSLSNEEYLQQANAICRNKKKGYSQEIMVFLQDPSNNSGTELSVHLDGVKTVILPINEAQLKSLRELGAPEGDEAEVEAALNAQQSAIDKMRATDRIQSFEQGVNVFADATEMLESYGLKDCTYFR